MSEADIINKLEHKGVKPTSNRILVLKTLERMARPMSISDLEKELVTMDKSSIFRVMAIFHEHDVVDSFEDGRGQEMFEICGSEGRCDNSDAHLHFYCEKCHQSYCLKELKPNEINLPEGFLARSTSFVINGICSECNKK
jgi:Fur family ferric uptake transcriptional regulator